MIIPFLQLVFAYTVCASRIVLTNDDGWAVALVRAQNDALKAAGHDIILSCPATDKSGTGSSTTTPTPLKTPCEFKTCPVGSPATGFNASDPRLNYVNAYPVDAAIFGIQMLAPEFWSSRPDFVFSGPNVGNNAGGLTVHRSGTVGAATEAAKQGIPAAAFSGATASHISYTTLTTNPDSKNTRAALIYSALSVKLLETLFASSGPILPNNTILNVNFPSTSKCTSPDAFKFVLTRINWAFGVPDDVETCGMTRLPTESSVLRQYGCFASVSVMDAGTKGDVDAETQAVVLEKLEGILDCGPRSKWLIDVVLSTVTFVGRLFYV
ncbi:sure-like protein [Roridomyces roridus]|uniref:Sure-like protein n=1 Tax=Roridomyces roridus TaxID=1738132 RepID=A0AAD7FEL8_9AGAR|nr:sure-like protein [Roridomyces roridus]